MTDTTAPAPHLPAGLNCIGLAGEVVRDALDAINHAFVTCDAAIATVIRWMPGHMDQD